LRIVLVILKKVESIKLNTAVIGQGYVGLPLSVTLAKFGYQVVGIDVDTERVKSLNLGVSPIEDVPSCDLVKILESGKYLATTDYSAVTNCGVVVICVPTPLTSTSSVDLNFLRNSIIGLAGHLKKGTLVIVESTVAPGTVRNIVVPLIETVTNLPINNFQLAFSPERIDPRNKDWNIQNTPKIVAGLTSDSLKFAAQFYSSFIENVVQCESLEVAETAKLLENSFRLINISFINEVSIFCQKLGIDIESVIKAAATKPYGFMPFYPSIGAGGHCIPVDPVYLADKAAEIGTPIKMISVAGQINNSMPIYFVGRAEEILEDLDGKRIIVIGLSYKPNVADVRETPVEALILGLKNKGAEVCWHDDLVKEWNGEKSVALSNEYDLAILATPHDYLDLTKLGNVPILNTRGSI
jgi:UDP-N-acetyl-D-glucosamine dehydrogenase